MKICSKCKLPKPLKLFALRNGERRHSYCNDCQRPMRLAHYEANKVQYVVKVRERRAVLQEFVDGLKRDRPCADCKRLHPSWRLDFDHRPGTQKVADVSTLIHKGAAKKTILIEVSKCDLVCANCHRDRTHERKTAR